MKTKTIYECERCKREEITSGSQPNGWESRYSIEKTLDGWRLSWQCENSLFLCDKCDKEYNVILTKAKQEIDKFLGLEHD